MGTIGETQMRWSNNHSTDKGNLTAWGMDREDYDKRICLVLSEWAYAKILRDPTKNWKDNMWQPPKTPEEQRNHKRAFDHKCTRQTFPYHQSESPTYNLAQHLAWVITPLTGKNLHPCQTPHTLWRKSTTYRSQTVLLVVRFDMKSYSQMYRFWTRQHSPE